MTLTVSSPLTIPPIRPEFSLNYTLPPNTTDTTRPPAIASPGGVRRAISQGQQFGRYHSENDDNTAMKNSSSMSLEALAVLLAHSPGDNDDHSTHSPPARSKGFHDFTPKIQKEFYKSRSFPTVKPSQYSSSGHHKVRPPVRKVRSVKFADAKGLPLASVRKLTAADPFETEGGIVPKLLNDLGALTLQRPSSTPTQSNNQQPKIPVKKICFPQPGTHPEFISKLRSQQVCLESVYASQPKATTGVVRVMNLSFDKEVTVRWTNNKWSSYHDTQCAYCYGSSDKTTDRFSFTLPTNNEDNIEFAVRYKVNGIEYWDSNGGQNYLITTQH